MGTIPSKNLRWYEKVVFMTLCGVQDTYCACGISIGERISETYDLMCDAGNDFFFWEGRMRKRLLEGFGVQQGERFERFKELPAEIRGIILEFAVAGTKPRVVELRRGARGNSAWTSWLVGGKWKCGDEEKMEIWSTCQIPPLLHACRESRLEALKAYEYAFDGVWVDFGRDTIFCGRKCDFLVLYNEAGRKGEKSEAREGEERREREGARDLRKVQVLAIGVVRSWAIITRVIEWERLWELRSVVVVGDEGKGFELGGNPKLTVSAVTEEDEIRRGVSEWTGGMASICRREVERTARQWNLQRERKGQIVRQGIVVREGEFIKGSGDRWHVSKKKWEL